MNSDRSSNVMPALFLVTIIVVISVFAYLYLQQGSQVARLQGKIETLEMPQVSEKKVEAPIKEEKDTSVAPKKGYTVEQENGVSTVSLRDSFGGFTFKAPENIWGVPRVEVIDYSATDGPVSIEDLSRLAGYKFRAGSYYSEGNKGYVFELRVTSTKYKSDAVKEDGGIKVGENDNYIYYYVTFTDACIKEKYCSKKDAVEMNNAISEIMKTIVFAK